MPITFRPGVTANDARKPRLLFAEFRSPAAIAPASADYSGMPIIGMLGNDAYGDCVFAGNGHTIEALTFNGQGREYVVTLSEVLAAYGRVTGFRPQDPSTDRGASVQDGLGDLRKNGYGGHRIAAFAEIQPSDHNDVKLAIAEFGAVAVGMAFPAIAEDQFNAGQPWDLTPDDGPIQGGHRVTAIGYDERGIYCYTWDAVHPMTWRFWDKYVASNGGEAWAHVSYDWVSAVTGKDPEGIDLAALGAQFSSLTGEPSPFPAPKPSPAPVPPAPVPPAPVPPAPPAPVPGAAPDAADLALATAARRYLRRWLKPAYLTIPLRQWLADHDL